MTAIAATGVRGHQLPRDVPLWLASATVLTEIANPLASGQALAALTVVTVLLFGAATTTQLLIGRGWRDCLRMLVITIGIGYAAEAIGVHTGAPFGDYHYTHTLGVELLGVPLIIPLAWTMMAWPALCVGRRLGAPVLVGGLALASWDLFLDPQMVHDGYWVWSGPAPRLNGIPLVNHLGWLVVAILLMAALNRAVPALAHSDDALPLGLWLWTFGSSVLANLVFFQRPLVALAGGVGMGVLALPLTRHLLTPPVMLAATRGAAVGAALLAVHAAANPMRSPPAHVAGRAPERISVLLPLRDEAHRVTPCLRALLEAVEAHGNAELIVLDDGSTDGTGALVLDICGDLARLLEGTVPPAGWLGKPHACRQLCDAADPTSSALVFLDADGALP